MRTRQTDIPVIPGQERTVPSARVPMHPVLAVWVGVLITAFLLPRLTPAEGAVVDRVVAVVNNEIITLSELRTADSQATSPLFEQLGIANATPGEKKRLQGTLRFLIERKLQLQAASRRGITVGEDELQQALEEIKIRNGIASDNALQRLLAEEDLTLQDYLKEIKEQILILKLVNREIRSNVVLQEHELSTYYRRHAEEFQGPEQVSIGQILLTVPANATPAMIEEIRRRAMELHAELSSGASFQELARAHSQGPDAADGGRLGWFKEGELMEVVDQAVFSLQVGEITMPVRTPIGFHIFKLFDRTGKGPLPFEAVRNRVEERLFLEKVEWAYRSWLKRLRDQAYVEVRM